MAEIISIRTGGIDIQFENIPAEFKEKDRWVLWRWHNRAGKRTKPPFQPNGKQAKVNDPSTFSSYQAVYERLIKDNEFVGIGFVLSPEDNIIGWDLDHCINVKNGSLEPWAEQIVTKLNSYTEITPSGEGLRIFVRGKLPEGRRKVGNVECYQELRYLTVTGNLYPGINTTIEPNNLDIWESIFNKRTEKDKERETKEKVKKERTKTQLDFLIEGDWASAGYPSHSEADAAYCRHLAEETAGNAEKIDELFRASKLFRTKWDVVHSGDGQTYGQLTIKLALESWHSRFRLTDLGNAKRLAKIIKDEVRFCEGTWFIWDGKRLKEDKLQRIYLYAQKVIDELKEEAKNSLDREERGRIWKHMLQLESRNRIEAMIALTESQEDIAILIDDLDKDNNLFNCENGILTIDGKILPHNFDEMITKLCPIKINPKAKAPHWENFLCEILPIEAVRNYVQKAIGYSMTGSIAEQCLFFMYGVGSNGKSTFCHIITKVFGDYASQLPVESLMATKNDQHPTVLADLRGVRFVLASEPEDGRRFNEGLLKQITGGEKIVARRMRENFFKFESTAKLWIMGNHLPNIRGTDHAIWRRIRRIDFTTTIPKERQDKELWSKLEGELEGILMWCIHGLKKYMKEGLEPPKEISDATENYRKDMDVVQDFLDEETIEYKDNWLLHSALYERYAKRASINNERLLSSKAFAQKLREKGFIDARRTGNHLFWKDLAFIQGEDQQEM